MNSKLHAVQSAIEAHLRATYGIVIAESDCALAQAALTTLLEPTDRMKFVGSEALDSAYDDHNADFRKEASAAFHAMITAALNEEDDK